MSDTAADLASRDSTVSEILARAAVYRLVSRLWLRELDTATLGELLDGPLRDAFVAAGGSLPELVDAETMEALAFDYCQLFLGPSRHLPPYQSVWTEGQFQGTAVTLLRRYLDLLSTSQWDTAPIPDHLGIELEIMAYLLEQRAAAEAAAVPHADIAQIAEAFFRDHLAWPGVLCAAASQQAQTAFYRTMIEMTDRFLVSERETL